MRCLDRGARYQLSSERGRWDLQGVAGHIDVRDASLVQCSEEGKGSAAGRPQGGARTGAANPGHDRVTLRRQQKAVLGIRAADQTHDLVDCALLPALDFQVDPGFGEGRDQLRQTRDADPGVSKRKRDSAVRREAIAGIELLEVCVPVRAERPSTSRRAIDGRVVLQHDHAVAGGVTVRLQVRHARRPGLLERGEGILWRLAARSPVAKQMWPVEREEGMHGHTVGVPLVP